MMHTSHAQAEKAEMTAMVKEMSSKQTLSETPTMFAVRVQPYLPLLLV